MKGLQTALVLLATASPLLAAGGPSAAPDAALTGVTNAYQKIADTIIAANHSEEAIVKAIRSRSGRGPATPARSGAGIRRSRMPIRMAAVVASEAIGS